MATPPRLARRLRRRSDLRLVSELAAVEFTLRGIGADLRLAGILRYRIIVAANRLSAAVDRWRRPSE